MDLDSFAGVAVWFFGVSIVAAGVILGLVTIKIGQEIMDQLEISWIKTKTWWRR